MNNEIVSLENRYQEFTENSKNIGKSIADSVSMLQLDEINEGVAEAVIQIEQLSNKTEKSAFENMWFIGKYVKKAKEKLADEELKSGKMVDVVDRLFNNLTAKKQNIESVMGTLFALKEQLIQETNMLVESEAEAHEIAEVGDNFDAFKAKNLLVQVKQSIINTRDRIGIIDATCKAAEASSVKISSMLPSLQGELTTELAIQAGLQELKEFKQVFDSTVQIVEGINRSNNENMKSVLEDVVDLSIVQPRDLARLENLNADRDKFQNKIAKKLADAKQVQEKSLVTLTNIRNGQQALSYFGEDTK